MTKLPRRLIEVDLPIARISTQARREKSIRHGHLSTLHIWWARRPLAACRAVVLASLWPDPVDLAEWARRGDEVRLGDGPTMIRPARFLDEAQRQMKCWLESRQDLSPDAYKRLMALQ
jgi:adenine-specific DNA methylase